jgi:hypothetical protein
LIVERGQGSGTGEVCYDYLRDVILKYGLNGVCAFMIAVINKIETDLLKKMIVFLRCTSESKEVAGVAKRASLAIFMNSCVVVLLANANVYGAKPGFFPYDVTRLKYFKQEDEAVYDGFLRDWYTSIGMKILWIAILNVINPHFSSFLFWVP